MAKPYDATTKELFERHPADWLALLGLPQGTGLRIIDADLSSFTLAADKVIWVDGPVPYIVHIEFQAGPDARLDSRMMLYNVVLRWRHDVPVRTAAILLRREAQLSSVTGRVQDRSDPHALLDFSYLLVRAWEVPTGQILAGGIGTLPLAVLTAADRAELPDVILGMQERLRAETPRQQAVSLLTAAYILAGLRYSPEVVDQLFQGVHEMEESSTYQAILERGLERGRTQEARTAVLVAGTERLGPPDAEVLSALNRIQDVDQLEALLRRAVRINSWDELLAPDTRS